MRIMIQIVSTALLSCCLAADAQEAGLMTARIPEALRVPDGNSLYLKAHATGTQNYVCVPGPSGPAWKFLGPQATLFIGIPWPGGEIRQQVATHYLSANPAEDGVLRATWQHSIDSSAVWAKAIATVTEPPVKPGAIPWLLLQVVGNQSGPAGGAALRRVTYIQRVNTSGGTAPSGGCSSETYGAFALVPYATDYLFYTPRK